MDIERNDTIDQELNYRDTLSSNLSLAEQRAQARRKKSSEFDTESRQTRETNITRDTRELNLQPGSKPVYRVFKIL